MGVLEQPIVFSSGGEIIKGTILLSGDIESLNGDLIWDSGNAYIPVSSLQSDSINISTGSSLTGGGSASLGGNTTLSLADNISLSGIDVDNIGDNGQGLIEFSVSDVKRAELDSNGDLEIEGSLTEGSAL